MITLLNNASGAVTGAWQKVPPGDWVFEVDGTFSSTSAKLQLKSAAGNGVDVAGAVLAAAGHWEVSIPADMEARAVLTGGTPTGMSAVLKKMTRGD